MPTLKVGVFSDAEITSQIQALQSEQTRRSKMREETASFIAGSPGRLAVLASILPMPATNGNGQHKAVTPKAPKAVKAKVFLSDVKSVPKMPAAIKIKYRDPANKENTWSGRGRPARWLATLEKQGHKRDEYLVA